MWIKKEVKYNKLHTPLLRTICRCYRFAIMCNGAMLATFPWKRVRIQSRPIQSITGGQELGKFTLQEWARSLSSCAQSLHDAHIAKSTKAKPTSLPNYKIWQFCVCYFWLRFSKRSLSNSCLFMCSN